MAISHSNSFADARQQKRELFQSRWNRWISGPLYRILLILLAVAQILFFAFSGNFIRFQVISMGFLGENHSLLYWGFIFAGQILCSAPGFVFLLGLWKTCQKTRWQENQDPDISGVRLIRICNTVLCIVTGILLFLYPTIVLTAGEYMKEPELLRLFFLLLFSTLLFALLIVFVRPVLKRAEENITCCWANTRLILPLILLLFASAAALLRFFSFSNLFTVAAAALCILYGCFLTNYWVFLRKVAIAQAAIDQKIIASRENPDDPYSWY